MIKEEIIFRQDLLEKEEWVEKCFALSNQFFIVCDTNVQYLGEKIFKKLSKKRVEILFFEALESRKTRQTKEEIEDILFAKRFDRSCAIIAIGGGVTLDLIGFVAATFCRGVKYIQIPTTLLAMVDASIGGKRGVNTSFGKNLVGVFYSAHLTLMDPNVLDTLSIKHVKDGLVEMIKHSLIDSKEEFFTLKRDLSSLLNRNQKILYDAIERSIAIKSRIVSLDKKEKNIRQILNFGHTIAHTLEKLENYKISHGQAVSIGLQVESFFSYQQNFLSKKEFHLIIDAFDELDHSFILSRNYSEKEIIDIAISDKKSKNETPYFVALEEIGKVRNDKKFGYARPFGKALSYGIEWMKKKYVSCYYTRS